MKTSCAAVLALATAAHALPSRMQKRACESAVTLDASTNVFESYTLHPNSFYRGEVEAAVADLSDPSLAAAAAKVADVGSFLWLYVHRAGVPRDNLPLSFGACGRVGLTDDHQGHHRQHRETENGARH